MLLNRDFSGIRPFSCIKFALHCIWGNKASRIRISKEDPEC